VKKFFFYLLLILAALGAFFTFVLYSEGAFDKAEAPKDKTLKPFEMKCEAGKCASGKCETGK